MNVPTIARAIMAGAVALVSTFTASTTSGLSATSAGAAAVVAGIGAFLATYAHANPIVKAVLSGLAAVAVSVGVDYGHVTTQQLVLTSVVQFILGSGLTAGTSNRPPVDPAVAALKAGAPPVA